MISVREPRHARVEAREPRDQLEADGLNVSIGGIAMRAQFVPEPGALLECTFTCPPTGEQVNAQGEVIWSEPHGPGQGQFGMRFVELDTKSATALRRLVNKNGQEPPKLARPRMARMQIDGLTAGVEAELKLVDETRVVLEQPLTFLQLGRGVEIAVPGRGNERGRIASIELRHGQFETPKLVFGILFDDAPAKAHAKADAGAAWFTGELEEPFPGLQVVKATATAWGKRKSDAPPAVERAAPENEDRISELALDRTSELSLDPSSARSLDRASARFRDPPRSLEEEAREALANASPTATLQGIGRVSELPVEVGDDELASLVPDEHPLPRQVVEVLPLTPPRVRDSESIHELTTRKSSIPPDELPDEPTVSEPVHDVLDEGEPESDRAPGDFTPLTLRNLPTHARILFKKQADQLAELRHRIEPALREQAESLDLPEAKNRVIAFFARLGRFFVALLGRFKRQPEQRETEEAPVSERRKVRLRMQRTTLPGIGQAGDEEAAEGPRGTRMIAVAVALAGVGLAAYVLAPSAPSDNIELPARIANAEPPAAPEEALAVEIEQVAPPKIEKKKPVKEQPEVVALPAFGESEVPNGRVFTLRMNGPITALEGQAFENGFTVKVPGRTPIDPARPIASAHRAVKRALFMSQGKFAELTIEFLPGFAPRYQVRAKGDALEITLERL
ncbi:MAG TPA: PilZ domain-containing protein [Polyangiales bacterium]|nr:PilZ domain-containing protein [Polyangiales bacterium]